MKAIDYLKGLRELLEIEKEEDIRLFQETVLRRSLQERVKNGISWYPVQVNRVTIGMGQRLMLEIEYNRKDDQQSGFQPGGIVSVFGILESKEEGRMNGVIASVRKNIMRVALGGEHIPQWIKHSKIGIDQAFDDKTYQEMDRALVKTIDPGKNERLAELREKMLGPSKPEFSKWDVRYYNDALNRSQNEAVEKALEAKDVAIIHGPPGTGKTTTLVAAIAEVVRRENQVLVCASSNTAVDLLTLRCHEQGIHVVRIGNPVRVEEQLQDLTLDSVITQHSDYPSLKKIRKDAIQAKEQALKFKRNFGQSERQKRQELLKEARQLKDMAHRLEDYILFQTLQRAQVVTSTLTGAGSKVLKGNRFHTVFVDEAGQALTPAVLIAMEKAQRIVMAGDHHQLPPTVKSMKADKGGLSKTLFEHVIDAKPETAVMLNRQYRMHEQIMGFSANQFYGGKLEADPSVRFHVLGDNFPALEFIDTAGCGFVEKQNTRSLSTYNPEEGDLLLKHLAILFNQIEAEIPERLDQGLTVGLIAPYKAQVRALENQLNASPMLSTYLTHIKVKTVDGFQGQERDVIYISLTRSNKKGEIGFLKDIRRMNVALTRARQKLVVVGDSATLGNHPFYAAFLQYIEDIGAYHSAWELMG
ncbi:MAG: AAA domain-containing protein [Bacteroidia bacterium]